MNHSDCLMSVTPEIKEPLFQGEPQFCVSMLNWDCGAKLGLICKRMGIWIIKHLKCKILVQCSQNTIISRLPIICIWS